MRYIVTILGYPRTGTNYLLCFIRKYFPNFNVNFEIYNPIKCFMNEDYLQEMLDDFKLAPNITNENKLVSLAHSYPIHFINQLKDIGKEDVLIYKIFPEHLPPHKVEKLLNISDLVIVNQRNILDTYISLEKAKDLVHQNVPNPWIKINTSNLKINFEENNFRLEREKYESWYEKNLEYLQEKNIPFVRLNYESFHELNNLEKQKFLQGIWLKYLPPDLSVLEERDSEMLEKQDTSTSYEEKISNYEEVKEYFI